MCIGATHTFTVTAAGTGLTYSWQVDTSGTGAGSFSAVSNGGVYSGQGTANLKITAAPATMNNYRYRVVVNGTCPGAQTSAPATLTLMGPTTTATFSTANVCVATDVNITANETFLNSAFGSRIWTGTYDDIPLGTPTALSAGQVKALLGGALNDQSLTPTFNSSGLGPDKVGQYVFTLTTTDNSGSNCKSSVIITINVGQIDANILYGSTSGSRTQTDLAAKVCSGYDVFLDGNPSGGSGTFTGHTWTLASGPVGAPLIGALLDNPAVQKPVFNTTFAGTYKLRYAVSDLSSSCNFTTGTLPKDITITVNPLPAAANQTPTVCSDPTTPTQAIVDLTSNNNSINPGPGVTIAWFSNYTAATKTFSGPIATPAAYTVSAGTVVYAQVSDNTTGCPSPAKVTYSLNQRPNLAALQAKTICSGDHVNYEILLSPLNSPAGTVFNWAAPSMSDGSSQGTAGVNVAMGAAGTIHITDVLVNKTGSPITALYKVTPSNTLCAGVQTTVTITVNPEPVVVAGQTKTICSGDQANKEILLSPLNAPAGTKFSWSQPAMSDGSIQGTAGSNVAMGSAGTLHITDVLTNKTGAQITATYTINSMSGAGCAGTPVAVKLFVNPEPVIVASQIKTICSGDAANLEILLSPLNAPAGTEFTWVVPTMSAGSGQGTARSNVPMGAAGTLHITDVFTNTTGSQISATYKVQATTNPNGCNGTQTDVVILVDPAPLLVVNQKKTICSGESVDLRVLLTPDNLPAGTTFSWSAPNMSDGSTQGSARSAVPATDALHITDVLTNTTSSPITATYTITPKSGTNCVGLPQPVTITINPLPPANPISGQNLVCTGTDIMLYQVTPHAGSTYTWTVDPLFQVFGGGGTNDFFVLLRFPTIGSGNISVIETNSFPGKDCPSAPNTLGITVSPPPAALTIDGMSPVCKGQTNVTFEIPLALFHSSSTYTWTVSGGNITSAATGVGLRQITVDFAMLSTASIQVTETSISGCAGAPAIKTITVDDRPAMTSLSAGQTCSGNAPSLVLTSSLPSTFHWQVISISGTVGGTTVGNSGDITTGPFTLPEILTNASGLNGIVQYRVTPIGNCAGNPQDVSITVLPEPVLSLNTKTLCSDEPAAYEIKLSPANIPAGTTFTWSAPTMSDASTQGSGSSSIPMGPAGTVHINDALTNTSSGPITASYVIDAMSGAGCNSNQPPASRTVVFTVNPKPVGGSDTKPVCSNASVSYDLAGNITTKGNNLVTGTTYTWLALDNANVTGESLSNQPGAFITDVLRNVTPSNQNVSYIVTPRSALNCAGTPFDVTITVQPEPVVANNLDVSQCSDVAYGLDLNTDGASVAAATYDINAAIAAGLTGTATTGASALANAIRNDKFTNKTSSPLTVTYTVTPTGVNSCVGSAKVVLFTINPEPVMAPQVIPDICSNNAEHASTTNIVVGTDGSSINATSYRLDLVEYKYSTAVSFSGAFPAGFTADGTNQTIGVAPTSGIVKNDKFTNASDKPVNVKYTITPISPAPQSCKGDPMDFVITIDPQPTLNHLLAPLPVCSDVISNIVLSVDAGPPASVTAAEYTIGSISLSTDIIAGPSNTGIGTHKLADAIKNDTYTNTTSSLGTVTYEVAPVSAGGCIGLTAPVILNVNPAPDILVPPISACTDAASGLILAGNPSAISPAAYDVLTISVDAGLVGAGGNAVAQNNVAAGYLSADKFNNAGDVTHKVSYTVQPVSAASCKGPTKVVELTIEPTVKVAPVVAQSALCGDGLLATSITLNSPTVPSAGRISFNYGATGSSPQISGFVPLASSLPTGYVIADRIVNNTNNPGTVTYSITPVAAGAHGGVGCSGTPFPVVITAEPKPKLTLPTSVTICEGSPVGIILNSPTTPTVGNPRVYFDMTTAITGHPTGYTPSGRFANAASLPDMLGNTDPTNSTVSYTFTPKFDAAFGTCVGPDVTTVVTVSHRPRFTSPIANFAICSGDAFAPKAIDTDTESAMPGSTIVTWTATPTNNIAGESNGAGNSFSQVLFNTTENKQSIAYTLNATNVANTPSCAATPIPLTVTVYPNPKVVGLPTSVNVCNNGKLSPSPYPLQASTVAALGATFDWTVDNGSNGDLPVIPNSTNQTQINQTFVNNGSFLGTQQYTITAHLSIPGADNPVIDAGLGIDNVCTAQTDAVMVVNVAPQVGGDIYGFDLDGNTAANLYLCRGAKQFVYMDPVGLPLMTIDYEENGTPKQLTKLGGLSVLQVSPSTTTTYKLTKITDKFGCFVTPNKTVTVNVDEVDNAFSIVGPDINCSPFPVKFKYNQVAGTSYTWKWLDGPDSTTYHAAASVPGKLIKHTYVNPSPGSTMKFRASLDAFLDTTKYLAGCRKRPVVVEVKVYPTVAPAVFADRDVICSNDQVSFTNSTQGASTHRWFYRVAGSATELEVKTSSIVNFKIPNTSTSNPLVYEVVYQSTNGHCPAPDVVTPITVYRGVEAHFSHSAPTLFVGGHSKVTITNDSAPVDGAAFRYDWAFGINANPESSSSAGPGFNIDYTTPGPKELTLAATNIAAETAGLSCVDEYKETINIAVPPLIADFVVIPLKACFPTDITVTENRATGDTFDWRVLDAAGVAARSNADLPVFKIPAPGVYTVELTTSNSFTGDQKTVTKEVTVYDLPMASFDFRPGIVYVPDTEMLTYNFSDGATSYLWDFGDGTTSDEKEPTHTYRVEGVYDILLIAQADHDGGIVCVDTLARKVTAKQGGVTRVPNAFTPSPNGPSTSTGSNPTANSFNDVFLPQVKGAEEFNMQVFDRWGNLIFESNNSNVGWDGYDKVGKLLPAGVYVYKLTLRLSDGQRTTQVGDITMIR
jgi:gliding motility-associated-like protein